GPLPPLNLLWTSNVNGCAISWTSNSNTSQAVVVSGAGPNGAEADDETTPGLVTYTLQCGSLIATATIDWVSTAVPRMLTSTSNSWAAGVGYPLSWNATAGPCVASGGAPGDGWAGSKSLSGTQTITESQHGTYVFTLVCGSGGAAKTAKFAALVPLPVLQIW